MTPEQLADTMLNQLTNGWTYHLKNPAYGVPYLVGGIEYCVKNRLDYRFFIKRLIKLKPDFIVPLYNYIEAYYVLPNQIKEDILEYLEKFVILQ